MTVNSIYSIISNQITLIVSAILALAIAISLIAYKVFSKEPLHYLKQEVASLEKKSDLLSTRNAEIYKRAINLFPKKSAYEVHRLKNYVLNLNEQLKSTAHPFSNTKAYYSYTSDREAVYVDFSNKRFGGKPFSYGATQEEQMLREFPELADFAASDLDEEGRSRHPTAGIAGPDPIFFKNVTRVQEVDPKLYGRMGDRNYKGHLTRNIPQQTTHILAIAAPKLKTRDPQEQAHLSTVTEIFKTIMAGFTLVKEQKPGSEIHSGKLGCGAFNNNPKIVYLLHKLAAQHLGVDVVMHDYSDTEAYECERIWQRLSLKKQTLEGSLRVISEQALQNHSLYSSAVGYFFS